jgi:hypothetical protein
MANKHRKVWKMVFHKPLFKKQTHPKNLLMKKNREKLEPNSYINISTIEVYMELYVWVLIRPHFKFFSQKIIIGLTSLNRSMSALNRWIIGLTRWIGCLYIYIYIYIYNYAILFSFRSLGLNGFVSWVSSLSYNPLKK